jgi:PiT family inorganic phosphate transporter
VNFQAFLYAMEANPALLITVLLTLGVVFVNGWTDAPNAIATCVATRSMAPRAAIGMAAVCNFAGLGLMATLQNSVTQTIFNMVNFGSDARQALVALCAAMSAIVLWSVLAWRFGIPTSESHALIAGLTGAAVALRHGFAGVNAHEWTKVLWGLLLSVGLGFGLGFVCAKIIFAFAKCLTRSKSVAGFRKGQIAAAAMNAFAHGAQDGQKFMGVFLLGIALAGGGAGTQTFAIPLWLMVLCSVTMALGTSVGGYRIIKSVGMGIVHLEPHAGFAADLASGLCLLLSTVCGLPVSTTHTKTTAVLGVGAAMRPRGVHWQVAREMALAWVFTFPGCGLLGWAAALLFLKIF